MYNLIGQFGRTIYVNDTQATLLIDAVNRYEGSHYSKLYEIANEYGTGTIKSFSESRIDLTNPFVIKEDSVVICDEDTFDTLQEADDFCMQQYGVNFNTMNFLYGDLFLFSN